MDGTWQPSLRLGRVCAVSEHALYPRALYPSACGVRVRVRCIRVCALTKVLMAPRAGANTSCITSMHASINSPPCRCESAADVAEVEPNMRKPRQGSHTAAVLGRCPT